MSLTQPDGHLAMPAAGTDSPVLVLHPWWGLNNTIKAFCNRLAEVGFVAFAPDLYHGKVTDQIDEAETLVTSLAQNSAQATAELAEALKFLRERAGSADARVAVIGFSMGAYYALDLSANHPDVIHAVVLFYGTGPADFSKSKAAYLGHFAAADEYEPQENVDSLEADLKAAGRPVTFHIYPNTGHWFFEPDREQVYNQDAARLAWDRTIAFLRSAATS